MAEKSWVPDGRGLPTEALDMIASVGGQVHLRLISPGGRSARGACDGGLGEWWSGKSVEVTCPACLQVVHS